MSVLLDEVKEVSKGKPMMWVNLGGIWKKRRLCIVLSVVSGTRSHKTSFAAGRRLTTDQPAGFTVLTNRKRKIKVGHWNIGSIRRRLVVCCSILVAGI
jgi:hypothetical protein